MSLIDDRERLKRYAVEKPADIFTKIDRTAPSYWNEKAGSPGIMEYCFETPMELAGLIDQYISDPELQQIVIASAFKRKNDYCIKKQDAQAAREMEKLPEFVYAF